MCSVLMRRRGGMKRTTSKDLEKGVVTFSSLAIPMQEKHVKPSYGGENDNASSQSFIPHFDRRVSFSYY